MLNYEVDPEVLKPHIPAGTELDLWQGKALVSMVGFMFADTRVLGIRWPFHVDFEEVNLRFYVRYFDGTDWKRGAVFISEIVPKPAISYIANTLYKEHYRALPMRHTITKIDETKERYTYKWKLKGKWNVLGGDIGHFRSAILPGTPEEFILEHYWGYNRVHDKLTTEYQVEHVTWQTRKLTNPVLDIDIATLYGEAFVPYLSVTPYSAFFAIGSEVIVRDGTKLLF